MYNILNIILGNIAVIRFLTMKHPFIFLPFNSV